MILGCTVNRRFGLGDCPLIHHDNGNISKRKAMNRNWYNQKANPALNTKAGNNFQIIYNKIKINKQRDFMCLLGIGLVGRLGFQLGVS